MKMKNNRVSFYYSFILILLTILLNNCMTDKVNISEGVKYYQNGKYEKSIEYFENQLKKNPENINHVPKIDQPLIKEKKKLRLIRSLIQF